MHEPVPHEVGQRLPEERPRHDEQESPEVAEHDAQQPHGGACGEHGDGEEAHGGYAQQAEYRLAEVRLLPLHERDDDLAGDEGGGDVTRVGGRGQEGG